MQHYGNCPIKCNKCGKIGHKARECWSKVVATGANAQPIVTCYGCREKGHIKANCLGRNNPRRSGARGQEPAERRLEDVPIIYEFPDVFPEDLPRLPPPRQVEFEIELVLGAAPVARAPYRLAPLEMKELAKQLQELSDKGFIRPSSSPIVTRSHGLMIYLINFKVRACTRRLICDPEKMYAKFSKCEFWLDSVKFLGHVINSQGVHVDPAKVEAIKSWTAPKSLTEVRQFLGLVGYYQRFIEGFYLIVKPLTKLTQKNKTYESGEEEKEAFQLLKDKLSYFLPKKKTDSIEKLAELYLKEIMYRHGVPVSVISDRHNLFTSSWDKHLPLIEFSYNNSYHASIKAALFEALYGRKCSSPVRWSEVRESQLTGPELSYTDLKRRLTEFRVGDKVMLRVSPWRGVIRFGKRRKLSPRFIGPFKVIKRIRPVAYKLGLPDKLHGIHDTFHVFNLKRVGDKVMLRVSPWRGVIRFGKHGKLSPRFIGPFKVIERIRPVAYKLGLPDKLHGIHDTFHVSNLKRCFVNDDVVILLDEV
nr:hypothetical protein [Tanacetum cinerariifolium]